MLREISPRSLTSAPGKGTSSVSSRRNVLRSLPLSCSPGRFRRTLFLKRVFDLVVASLLAVLMLPVMLLTMMLVKMTSRGPSIYSQQRVGQFGVIFTIYKIRTMYHQCENVSGPRWCVPRDPRVTWLGKILRKCHLDELPQLWNVLRGDMSLIGPRPERPEIAATLRQKIEDYDSRLMIRPGISGEAQIHLPPDTCLENVRQKLVYDRNYIQNLSLWVDVKIIVCTILKMFGLYRLNEPTR